MPLYRQVILVAPLDNFSFVGVPDGNEETGKETPLSLWQDGDSLCSLA